MSGPFTPHELKDGLLTFEKGVNHGVAPELVPANQMADAVNVTVRGDFATPRPYFQKRYIDYQGNAAVQAAVKAGWFQAAAYFKPDAPADGVLLTSIAGRLYSFQILADRAVISDVTRAGNEQTATATQCWIWQAEKWAIWQDGVKNPIFYDAAGGGGRSNWGSVTSFNTFNTAPFTVPAVGATVAVTVNDATNLVVGDVVTFTNLGLMSVQDITAAPVITFLNITATPTGQVVATAVAANMYWQHTGDQLPPGRMGAYGLGRNWLCLTDGRSFLASDAVGGSSGTQTNNFRDAVLKVTENKYLAGGGLFYCPGQNGEIKAMKFAATLDASLGQGPLQVFTPDGVFSCNAPPDRLTWQDITNPILTQSLLAAGATGQDSTIPVNGDTFFRSIDGFRSLRLARRDESESWINSPISHELDPTPLEDSEDLLPWASSIVFDNRFLSTVGAVLGPHGPYFRGLAPLNFDPNSTLEGKLPPVWDARLWTGLNIYKLVVGEFSGIKRAFAFCYNVTTDELELYEILPDTDTAIADNQTQRVTMRLESGTLYFGQTDTAKRDYARLLDGEISVDELQGQVDFMVWWKPDQWPGWVPWAKWSECAVPDANGNFQFRPRMGLGEPSPKWCDKITGRPLREGYTFRVAIEITGQCTLKGMRFKATTIPEPRFAPPICTPLCPQ